MTKLGPPPSGMTFDWRVFRDWFYGLWKLSTNLTFGADASSYSAAISSTTAGDGGATFLRINGSTYDTILALTPGASPWTWINSIGYDVDFFATAATSITGSTYTRNGINVTVPFTTISVMCRVSSGDSITVTYTGALTAKVVPR